MIDIKNVSKWYGSFQVLTDCTTKIEKGEVVVVCGPSGSGKSTLIKTVNALEPFQKGDIVVDGISISDSKTNLLAAVVYFVICFSLSMLVRQLQKKIAIIR